MFATFFPRHASLFLIALFLVTPLYGGVVSFDFGGVDFSGDPIVGSGQTFSQRFAFVEIDDMFGGNANEVRVSLTLDPDSIFSDSDGVSGISHLWLNLVNDSLAGSITINDTDSVFKGTSNAFKSATDDFNVPSAGLFDIQVEFMQNLFDLGVTSVFDLQLTGPGTLNSNSFLASSEGGASAFLSAVHLNNTGDGFGSGHYAGTSSTTTSASAPEPASLAIFGLGGIGMFVMGRRRKQKQTT